MDVKGDRLRLCNSGAKSRIHAIAQRVNDRAIVRNAIAYNRYYVIHLRDDLPCLCDVAIRTRESFIRSLKSPL